MTDSPPSTYRGQDRDRATPRRVTRGRAAVLGLATTLFSGLLLAAPSPAKADIHDAVYVRSYASSYSCSWAGRGMIITGVAEDYWCLAAGSAPPFSWRLMVDFA